MKNKVLSISIAAYNVESFLSDTVRSLNKEKEIREKIEIIIVNDGSNDNTLNTAKELEAMYPESVLVVDKENGGYGSTINAALSAANGVFFRLLDGDDCYQTENLKDYIRFLERVMDSDLVISPYEIVDLDGNILELRDRHNLEAGTIYHIDKLEESLLNTVAMHEFAVKTELLKKNHVNITEKCFYTDREFAFLAFTYSDSIVKYAMPIYRYRIGREEQSVSVAGRLKNVDDIGKMLVKIIGVYNQERHDMPRIKRSLLWKIITECAISQFNTYLLGDMTMKNIKRLRAYDKNMKKENRSLYQSLARNTKKIRILRFTNYMTYAIFHWIMLRRLSKKIY